MTTRATLEAQLDELYKKLGDTTAATEPAIRAEIAAVRRQLYTPDPPPVRCSLSAADATAGHFQLRAMAKALPMPEESRQLLLRIAEALEAAR